MEEDSNHAVLCPNCGHICSLMYLPSMNCPICGSMFTIMDTTVGSPIRSEIAEVRLAQRMREGWGK